MSDYIKRSEAAWLLSEAIDDSWETDYAIDRLNEIPAADVVERPRWIPVTEQLPCLTTPVLITDGIEVDIAWMYGVPPRWITSFTAIDEDKLTHWMPLPQTPKEVDT